LYSDWRVSNLEDTFNNNNNGFINSGTKAPQHGLSHKTSATSISTTRGENDVASQPYAVGSTRSVKLGFIIHREFIGGPAALEEPYE